MRKLTFTVLLLSLSSAAFAENKVVVSVSLTPAGSFQATSTKLKGNLVKEKSQFLADKLSISLESFKTGIDLRDEHFWKHLDPSKKFPKITLSDIKSTGTTATAQLEVNGIKKPVSINFSEKGKEVIAKFTVKASSFNLAKAEYLGVGVNDDVTVEANIEFKERAAQQGAKSTTPESAGTTPAPKTN